MATYSHGIKILNSITRTCRKSYVATVYTKSRDFSPLSKIYKGNTPVQHNQKTYRRQSVVDQSTYSHLDTIDTNNKVEVDNANNLIDYVTRPLNYSLPFNENALSPVTTKIPTIKTKFYSISDGNQDLLICKKSQSSSAINSSTPENEFGNNSETYQLNRNSVSCEVLPIFNESGKIFQDNAKITSPINTNDSLSNNTSKNEVKSQVVSEYSAPLFQNNISLKTNLRNSEYNNKTHAIRNLDASAGERGRTYQLSNNSLRKFLPNQFSVINTKRVRSLTNVFSVSNNVRFLHTNKEQRSRRLIENWTNKMRCGKAQSYSPVTSTERGKLNAESPSNRWVKCKKPLTKEDLKQCLKNENVTNNFSKNVQLQQNRKNIKTASLDSLKKSLVGTVAHSKGKSIQEVKQTLKADTDLLVSNINQVANHANKLDVQNSKTGIKGYVTDISTNKKAHSEQGNTSNAVSLHSTEPSTTQHLRKFTNSNQKNVVNIKSKLTTGEHLNPIVNIEINGQKDSAAILLEQKGAAPKTPELIKTKHNSKNLSVSSTISGNKKQDYNESSTVVKSGATEEPVTSTVTNLNAFPTLSLVNSIDTWLRNSKTFKKTEHYKMFKRRFEDEKPKKTTQNPKITNKNKVITYVPNLRVDKKKHINALSKSNVQKKGSHCNLDYFMKNKGFYKTITRKSRSEELTSRNVTTFFNDFENRNTTTNQNEHEHELKQFLHLNKINHKPNKYNFEFYYNKNQNKNVQPLHNFSESLVHKDIFPSLDSVKKELSLEEKVWNTKSVPKRRKINMKNNIPKNESTSGKQEDQKETDPINSMVKFLIKRHKKPSHIKYTGEFWKNENKSANYHNYFTDKNLTEWYKNYDKALQNVNKYPHLTRNDDSEDHVTTMYNAEQTTSETSEKPASYKQFVDKMKIKLTKKLSSTNINTMNNTQYKSAEDKSFLEYFVNEYNKSMLKTTTNKEDFDPILYDYKSLYEHYPIPNPVNQLEPSAFTEQLRNRSASNFNNKILSHFANKQVSPDKHFIEKEKDILSLDLCNKDLFNRPQYKNTLTQGEPMHRYDDKYSKQINSTVKTKESLHKNNELFKNKTFNTYNQNDSNVNIQEPLNQTLLLVEQPAYIINENNNDLNLPQLPGNHWYDELANTKTSFEPQVT